MTLWIILYSLGSSLNSVPAGLWALIGTLVGTLGLRLLERWLSRNKDKADQRRDLNQELINLQTRLDLVEEDLSQWRQRAFRSEEQVALLRILIIKLGENCPRKPLSASRRSPMKSHRSSLNRKSEKKP